MTSWSGSSTTRTPSDSWPSCASGFGGSGWNCTPTRRGCSGSGAWRRGGGSGAARCEAQGSVSRAAAAYALVGGRGWWLAAAGIAGALPVLWGALQLLGAEVVPLCGHAALAARAVAAQSEGAPEVGADDPPGPALPALSANHAALSRAALTLRPEARAQCGS